MIRRDPASDVPAFDGLWDRIAAEVMRFHQAEATVWTGRIDFLPPGRAEIARGQATADGQILLSGPLVVDVLERLYAEGPSALSDPKFARLCQRGLKAAAHELGHLTASADWTIADRIRDLDRDEQDPAEEAFIEALTHRETPGMIRRVLPPELAEALARAVAAGPEPVLPSYPGWTIAANAFAGELAAEFEDLRADDVLRAGARESASRRPGALADLMISRTRLPELLSDPGRAAAFRGELAGLVGAGFAGLSEVETVKSAGLLGGERIAAGAIEMVRTSERFYTQMADFGGVTFDQGIAPASGAVGSGPASDHEKPGSGPGKPGPGKPGLGNGKDGPDGRG